MRKQNPYKWNVMIYLAGNNSLSEECIYGLTEALDARIGDEVAIFAQLNTGVHRGTFLNLRDYKTREELHRKLNEVLLQQATGARAPESESYPREIFKFVERCMGANGEYRAEHNMLILSGHGGGTLGGFLRDENPGRSKTLELTNLGDLMKEIKNGILEGKPLDIVGFDSCLMSMTEIAYAIRDSVSVMIGAEGFEPRAGWPYRRVLELISQHTDDVNSLARKIVNEYVSYYTIYQAASVSVDQAACDMGEMGTLTTSIQSLAETLTNILEKYPDERRTMNVEDPPDSAVVRDAVLLSHWEAQLYKNEQYTDLYDFCSLLKGKLGRKYESVRRACQNVLNAIVGGEKQEEWELADDSFQMAKGFVLKSCYSGWTVQYSHGVSIYFPWAEVPMEMQEYERLKFAKDSKWADFLRVYLRVTKRDPRPGIGKPTSFGFDFLSPSFNVVPSGFPSHRDAEPNRNGEPNRNAEPNRDADPNRNADPNKNANSNRSLSNLVGSMKNPPTAFFTCSELYSDD